MFQRILVPLDLTDKHRPAIAIAADLAASATGEVMLLHVIEVIPGVAMEEDREFYERLEQTAHTHLQRYGAELTNRRISWQAKILFGIRAQVITRYANETQADLVVLTSPRIDPKNPVAGWASLSYKISLLATCPVLLVK